MANKTKFNLVTLIVFAALAVSLIMTIVGVCIAWTTASEVSLTLSDWLELNKRIPVDGLGANAAFAIMTVIFTALTAIAFVVDKLANIKVMKWVTLGCAALLALCALVTLITAYTFVKDSGAAPGAGVWLVFIFGLIGGASAIAGELIK